MRNLRWYCLSIGALGLVRCLLPTAAIAAGDPFGTESLVPPTPYSQWALPEGFGIEPVPSTELAAATSGPLSLAQLTELALRNNPRTRQAWAGALAEAAQYGIEKSDFLPRVDLLINANRSRVISATSGTATHENSRYGPTLSLSYILFDFGSRRAELDAQGYRVLAANLTQNRVLQEVVFQVEQAYFRLLGVEQLVRAGNQALKSAEATLDAARRRHQAGLATIGDVFRSETAVAQATLNLRRAEGEVSKSRGSIASACGVPITTPLRIQAWSDQPPSPLIKEPLEAMLKKAGTRRPDIAAAESRVRAARAALAAANSAGKPTLELNLQTQRQIYTDSRSYADGNVVALNLRIPVFSGWRDEYGVRRAEAQLKQAEATRDLLSEQTEFDVWQAYYDLQTASSGIDATASLVQGATQSASVAAARYQSGVGNLLDLLTAQDDEIRALVQQIQSRLDWYTALARLNFALGASGLFGITQ